MCVYVYMYFCVYVCVCVSILAFISGTKGTLLHKSIFTKRTCDLIKIHGFIVREFFFTGNNFLCPYKSAINCLAYL